MASEIRLPKSRRISKEETDQLLSILPNKIIDKTFIDLFANKKNNDAPFKPYDIMVIPKGHIFNETNIETTVGRYLFNLFILKYDCLKLIGYQNYAMSGGGLGKLMNQLDKLLLEDTIDGQRYVNVIDSLDMFYGFVKFLGGSLNLEFVKPTPRAQALKEELVSKNKKALDNGDFIKMGEIENAVINVAKEEIKNMPAYEIYESGATGKMNNSFKNTTYFRGAIKNLADESAYNISTTGLLEGIPPEEMYMYADILVQGAYGRAIG